MIKWLRILFCSHPNKPLMLFKNINGEQKLYECCTKCGREKPVKGKTKSNVMEKGDRITVKRNYGTACDGMSGAIESISGRNAMIKFISGDIVELPLDCLIKQKASQPKH